MHRLKEWFGIKDWQGPEQKQEIMSTKQTPKTDVTKGDNSDSVNNSQTGSHAVSNERLAGPMSAADGAVPAIRPENESLYFKYNAKLETWLRQYIPVGPNECAQCRLVAGVTVGSFFTMLAYTSYKLEQKTPLPRVKRKYYKGMLGSFVALYVGGLYQFVRKQGFFQERKKGETQNQMLIRALQEDIVWYKGLLRGIRSKLEGTSSDSTTDSKSKSDK